jgi:acetamidase/formamidase
MLQEPLPELTWIYQVDRTRNVALFEAQRPVAGREPFSVELPLEPMLGTVGVAPPLREVRTSLTPDNFGGNMDTPEMRAGVTVYLPVNVPGALFSIGDGHYRQGEGESCGTAIEGAMDSTLIVELIKGRAPAWPRLENDEFIMTVGSWRIGQVEMVHWLGELHGIDHLDAYQLLTQISLTPIANVVDANYSAVTKVRKSLLPEVPAYDAIHRDLRARAAGVR